MYYLVDDFKKKPAKDLYDEIRELKERINLLENNVYTFQDGIDLEEAKAQWEYYEKAYNDEVIDKQNRIRKCFQWIK
jgi:cell division protein FtsB